jgi:hypothetical protein
MSEPWRILKPETFQVFMESKTLWSFVLVLMAF